MTRSDGNADLSMDRAESLSGCGETSSKRPLILESSGRDPGVMDCLRRAKEAKLEPHALKAAIVHAEYPAEQVPTPSPYSPLAALAVSIDVNFPAVLQMLRTAATAAAEEARASALLGMQGRFEKTNFLHRRLEKLWLLRWHELLQSRIDENASLLIGELQHQSHEAAQGRSTTASLSSGSSRCSLSSGESCDQCEAPGRCKLSPRAYWKAAISADNEAPSTAPSLSPDWQPLLRHNGTVIAPPVELLAAYAGDRSLKDLPYVPRRLFAPSTQPTWTGATIQAPRKTPGCVVGISVRSLLDLYIQAVRSLQPALLPKDSVILMAAVNVPMMFKVLEEHLLVVQPLDLNTQTLMPTEDSLQQAMVCWGSRIKALLVSHLYGGVCHMQPLVDFCTEHRLLLIEDCAEAFVGELYRGDWLAQLWHDLGLQRGETCPIPYRLLLKCSLRVSRRSSLSCHCRVQAILWQMSACSLLG